MRRRPPELDRLLPPELADPAFWPQCARFDGGVQPCSCWWAKAQREFLAEGGEWPGGPARELGDLIEMQTRFECREPFDGTQV